ncbi:MAG: nitrous oxide reductase accessory protein NosL [Ignavibacteriales bacterium]|nr:nitrous oxide reductase accessory protein NosL [Ignavibacteriales bacterium]
MKNILFGIILLVSTNCSNGPEPISYGHDSCDKCRMQIMDPKYGTELVTSKGKIYKFDSVECLAFYAKNMNDDENSTLWVTDFLNKNELVEKNKAYFLLSENLRSPMGLNLTAFSSQADLNNIKNQYQGKEINWDELIEYVNHEWQHKTMHH